MPGYLGSLQLMVEWIQLLHLLWNLSERPRVSGVLFTGNNIMMYMYTQIDPPFLVVYYIRCCLFLLVLTHFPLPRISLYSPP